MVCRAVVQGVGSIHLCIQGHHMSRPAFSPPHTVGQFRCPIESTRHTNSGNRSPAAEACRASLPVEDADERLVDGMILLLLLLVTAASGLMSGDTCNFPLTELGLVDTCNLTTDVDAYQVTCQSYLHNSQCFRFNHGNSTSVSTQLGSGVLQKMPTTR